MGLRALQVCGFKLPFSSELQVGKKHVLSFYPPHLPEGQNVEFTEESGRSFWKEVGEGLPAELATVMLPGGISDT